MSRLGVDHYNPLLLLYNASIPTATARITNSVSKTLSRAKKGNMAHIPTAMSNATMNALVQPMLLGLLDGPAESCDLGLEGLKCCVPLSTDHIESTLGVSL